MAGEFENQALRPDDAAYVYQLCEATMRPYVVALRGRWDEGEVRSEILRDLTDGCYRAVLAGDARVGVVSVAWSETCCEIVQLFIDPKHQRRGFGASTVDMIVREAQLARRPVIARVLVTNPALAFWEKAGFSLVESTDDHHLLAHHE